MTQRITGTNNNYKIYCRIRPIEYTQKMIEIQTDTNLTIKDPSIKSSEKQQFSFNGVFDSNSNQETVWSHTTEPILQKLIEGHNGVIMSYGQTGSGKTFNIFGEDERYSINNMNLYVDSRKDKRGLICRSVEFLFKKAQELEDIREFVITCSIAEIYLEKVRDLGKAYVQTQDNKKAVLNQGNLMNNFENENLAIKESTNGQVIIQDLTQITVKNMNELYDLISSAFLLRNKFETKGSQIWARAHTIFTVNLVQKDKENDLIPFLNSSVQFVDLAGSERIAKSLTEGHKFQEAILINSSLTSLGKCLQMIAKSSKSVPYRESKITKILQNCMTYSSHTVLFVNLNPSESNFEECLSSLQYAERTRNASLTQKQPMNQGDRQSLTDDFVMNVGGQFSGSDKVAKKLQEELSDLKSKLEFNQREHREKLVKIADLLGLEVDLDKVLNKASYKELTQFRQQKEAQIQLENVKKQNEALEHKIDKLQSFIKEQQQEERLKEEENTRIKVEQSEVIKQLKERLNQHKMQNETMIQKLNNEREFEIRNMIEKSNQLLEEKSNIILNLPIEIEKKTQENQKLNEVKKATKYEVEKEYKTQIESLKQEYSKLLDNTKQQYEYFLKQKNEEMDTYVQQLKKYREKKLGQIKEMQEELVDLNDIIQKQSKIINKVETGQYSGGIRSFNIPQRDKPPVPNRQKHKNLFQLLDQNHLTNTINNDKMKSLKMGNTSNLIDNQALGSIKKGEQSLNTTQQQIQQRSIKNKERELYDNLDDLIDLQVNLQKIIQGKDFDQFQNLQNYAQRIKDSLQQSLIRERDLKKRVQEFEQINSTIDIQALQKERDEYKQKYLNEMKKHNQSRVAMESQKRVISAKFQNNLAGYNFNNNTNKQNLPSVTGNQQFNIVRPHTVQDGRFSRTGTGFYNK